MTEEARDLLARVFADVQAAVSSAKKLYPDAPAEIIRLAAADFLVHVRELRRLNGPQQVPAADHVTAGQPGGTPSAVEVVPPVCECGRIMVAVVVRKNLASRPDYRCPGAVV